MILYGSQSQSLAYSLSQEVGVPLAPMAYDRFPDGELLIRVDTSQSLPGLMAVDAGTLSIDGPAVAVASTATAADHLELLQLQDIARAAGADPVITVIPYMGYARQEIAHEPGQPASARAMARAIGATTDYVFVVDPHEALVCEYFGVPAEAVSAVGELATGLSLSSDQPVFLAPDEGAIELAETLQAAYGCGSTDFFVKERLSGDEVDIKPSATDVTDREVVIVDDIVATGSTMATATELLYDGGAASVHVSCVHPLFVESAYSRLRRAGVREIVATDTLERPVSQTSAAAPIAAAIADLL